MGPVHVQAVQIVSCVLQRNNNKVFSDSHMHTLFSINKAVYFCYPKVTQVTVVLPGQILRQSVTISILVVYCKKGP